MNTEVYTMIERGLQYSFKGCNTGGIPGLAYVNMHAGLQLWNGLMDMPPQPLVLKDACRVMHFNARPRCSILSSSTWICCMMITAATDLNMISDKTLFSVQVMQLQS
jgi:hypothetical protein